MKRSSKSRPQAWRNKRAWIFALIVLVVFVGIFAFASHSAFAAGTAGGVNTGNSAQAGAGQESSGFFSNALQGAMTWVLQKIGNFILIIMSLVLYLAGKLLDISMYFTVHMADVLQSVPVVNIGWSIFRDLANMLFIFVLLYIAIATILNIGNTKRMLVDIIITALLINFSLFITQAIVDASNIVAIQFYDRINTLTANANVSTDQYQGPSAALRNAMQIQTVYSYQTNSSDVSAFTQAANQITDVATMLATIAGGAFIMLVASFVFATGALLLFIRIVTLMFLMMISPLAFVARILPSTQAGFNRWWHALINNAIFAPVYLAMTYVVLQAAATGLKAAGAIQASTQQQSFASLFSANAGANLGILINYVFITLLLIGVILISKQISVVGANTVQKWATSGGNAMRSFAGRHTLGRAARRFEEYAETRPFLNRAFPSKIRELTTQPLQSSKFGGSYSAKDVKKIGKERETAFEEASRIKSVRTELARLKPGMKKEEQDAIMGKVGQEIIGLAPSAMAHMDMKDFKTTPELASMINEQQYTAIMNSDKTQKDKDTITELRFKREIDSFGKYNQTMSKYMVAAEKDPTLFDTMEKGGLAAVSTKLGWQGKDAWTAQDQEAFNAARNIMRGKSVKELGLLNRTKGGYDMINNTFTAGNLNWWQISGMRSSPDFTTPQREASAVSLRDLKDQQAIMAEQIAYGVPMADAHGNLRTLADRFGDVRKRRSVIEKIHESGRASLTADEEKLMKEMEAVSPAQKELAAKMIKQHFAGRQYPEMASMRGAIRVSPIIHANLPSGAGSNLAGKDEVDIGKHVRDNLYAFGNDKMTQQQKGFLAWMLFDRQGKNYYQKWESLAQEMEGKGTVAKGTLDKLKSYYASGDKKSFEEGENTVDFVDTLPGSTITGASKRTAGGPGTGPTSGGSTPSGGTPPSSGGGGGGSGGSGGSGGGGGGGPTTPPSGWSKVTYGSGGAKTYHYPNGSTVNVGPGGGTPTPTPSASAPTPPPIPQGYPAAPSSGPSNPTLTGMFGKQVKGQQKINPAPSGEKTSLNPKDARKKIRTNFGKNKKIQLG